MGDYITTFTGKHFYPMSPDPMAICILLHIKGALFWVNQKKGNGARLFCKRYNNHRINMFANFVKQIEECYE